MRLNDMSYSVIPKPSIKHYDSMPSREQFLEDMINVNLQNAEMLENCLNDIAPTLIF